MSLDDLKRKRQHLHENTDRILSNMQVLADESTRVANVAHNAQQILDNLEDEFERQTGFNKRSFPQEGRQLSRGFTFSLYSAV